MPEQISTVTTELVALLLALNWIETTMNSVVLCLDSAAALQAVVGDI